MRIPVVRKWVSGTRRRLIARFRHVPQANKGEAGQIPLPPG
jgi:hypothetical protein